MGSAAQPFLSEALRESLGTPLMVGGSGAQCEAHAEDCLSASLYRGTRDPERTVGQDLHSTGRTTGKPRENLERVRDGTPASEGNG